MALSTLVIGLISGSYKYGVTFELRQFRERRAMYALCSKRRYYGDGLIPLILWPAVYEQYRGKLRETFVLVAGKVSRKEGTVNVVVEHVGTWADFRTKQGKLDERPGTERFQKARPHFW